MSGAVFREEKGFKNRNRVEKVRVKRHFAGRTNEDSDDDISDEEELMLSKKRKRIIKKKTKPEDGAMVIRRGNISTTRVKKPPPRILSNVEKKKVERIVPPPPLPTLFNPNQNGESSDEESSSSSDSDSDSDDGDDILSSFSNTRFSFVKKSKRKNVVKTKEEIKEEEEKERVEKLENMKKRKEETQLKLLKILVDEEKREEDDDIDSEDEDLLLADDEDNDDDKEYELWIEREKRRVIQYKTQRDNVEKEKKEIHRLRNLGEKEREELDKKLTLKHQKIKEEIEEQKRAGKSSFQFMQRYYKKPVFFQGEDEVGKEEDVFKRDFQEPTMQDKTNYKMLPKILQNKYFGMKGNVKWTHLSKEDTTDWKSPSFQNRKDRKNTGLKRNRKDSFDFDRRRMKKRKKK